MSLRVVAGTAPSLVFEDPLDVWAPRTLDEALAALRRVDDALDAGYYVAGALSYELGALLHAIPTPAPSLPLLLLGVYRTPQRRAFVPSAADDFTMAPPLSRVDRRDYERCVHTLLHAIHDGEVYQVNYTVPFDVAFSGDPFDLYRFLAARSDVRYSAYVEHDDVSIVSLSPELFLRFEQGTISAKPMKGTATLADPGELHSAKNRAEHLMIVDLLRNDLHRVCDDVRVPHLFEIERYPTLATMTSTITGTLRPRTRFEEIVRATFPCGSVTGAPKRAALQHIAAVEPQARGFYTGSIGFLSPQRRGWWNVCIRTLQFERGAPCARFDAGGGIVSDSQAAAEWDEIRLKSRFLQPALESFRLWETLRGGTAGSDMAAHVDRLVRSAHAFGWRLDARVVLAQLTAFEDGTPHLVRVRAGEREVLVKAEPLAPTAQPVRLCLSRYRVRSDDPMLAHKSAWRPMHEAAAREAHEQGCFDAILRNERGELTEGSRSTIFVQFGDRLYTPPLAAGVLPGILRARLVSEEKAMERTLFAEDLARADAIYVGNSARGLLAAHV